MTTGLTASIVIFSSFCHPNIWCWCIPFILPANTQFPTPKWKHLRNANLKRRCAPLLPPSWFVKVLLPFDYYYNTCEAMQSDHFALLTFWLSLLLMHRVRRRVNKGVKCKRRHQNAASTRMSEVLRKTTSGTREMTYFRFCESFFTHFSSLHCLESYSYKRQRRSSHRHVLKSLQCSGISNLCHNSRLIPNTHQ